MPDAPALVPYAALVMSALSLVVSTLAFRAGGPRLSLRMERASSRSPEIPFPSGAPVRLAVVNAGRAAVTIESFALTPYGSRRPAVIVRGAHGPALPHRLEAHASDSWYVDALPAARDYDARLRAGLRPWSSWPSHFRFTVQAGNGKRAHAKEQLDALRVIADAQPPP
ncbi:hypothetical protein [Terrabacter sp. 2YAF2]|uniref:hypothetical protein n=1 Tax=Terrabacter sp. 2YAF2 TaxID=3233026 RepID=UPI003F94696A